MADTESKPQNSSKSQRFVLPIIIITCVTGVFGLFTIGFLTLTTAEPPAEDIIRGIENIPIVAGEKATNDETVESNETDQPTTLPDGQFDFARHRYYTFPLPFVSNLASGKGMLTVEIAVATFGNTLTGEAIIKKLETVNPKMRSAINLRLSELKLGDIDNVNKRNKLANRLLDDIKLIVDGPNIEEISAITDLHLIKFVISEAQ